MCHSVKGGTWRIVNIDKPSNSGEYKIKIVPHHASFPHIDDSDPSPDAPPANIHEDKIFLIKLQISLSDVAESMLIYDRQRSFQVIWYRKNQQDLFDEVEETLGNNLKMFRWARWVEDYQLSVCFDKVPPYTPLW